MTEPPVIEVLEIATEEVAATGADVSVTLSGAKYFSGAAALQQAVEIRKLVEALAAAGIAESDVGIDSVRVDASKGMLTKSSSATYVLNVRCREPNKVAAVIDAVSVVKNCVLGSVSWRYDVPDSVRHGWLAACVQRARGSAESMARASGSKITHVHRIVDVTHGERVEATHRGAPGALMEGSGARRVADALEGMDLAPKQKRQIRIRAWFAIAAA